MSERSLNRAHARRLAAAGRRDARLRRRMGLMAGAAAGATALFAPAAQAATFEVNSLNDAEANACETTINGCTLRDAIAAANAPGADTITFASTVTGVIRLTNASGTGTLRPGAGELTIVGPGAGKLTVSGNVDASEPDPVSGSTASNGDVQILSVGAGADVTLSGLTLSGGSARFPFAKYGGGAASVASDGILTVRDAVLERNSADTGGAISNDGTLTVERSTLSGNVASNTGGAISRQSRKDFNGPNSRIRKPAGALTVRDSVVSGNTAGSAGGGIAVSSSVSDEPSVPAPSTITMTVIADNSAGSSGGGVYVAPQVEGDALTISRSTLRDNKVPSTGPEDTSRREGGGLYVTGTSAGATTLTQSTLAGNSADRGAGVFVSDETNQLQDSRASRAAAPPEETSPLLIDGTTITQNAARSSGGGLELGRFVSSLEEGTGDRLYSSVSQPVTSSVIAGNTAAGAPGDLGQEQTEDGEGVVLSHSLVQTPGEVTTTTDPAAPSLLGVDPLLGALAANGGLTQTALPAEGSPLLDAGRASTGTTTDQRGASRTVDLAAANAAGGDGTDIGAVERGAPPVAAPVTAPPASTPVTQAPKPPAASPTSVIAPLPTSRPKKPSVRRQPITLRGTASVGTRTVRVAVARKSASGKTCRFLKANGTFAAPRDCRRTSYVTAKGTRSWTLKLPVLAKGRYIVWSRAIADPRVETKTTMRNFTRITIR